MNLRYIFIRTSSKIPIGHATNMHRCLRTLPYLLALLYIYVAYEYMDRDLSDKDWIEWCLSYHILDLFTVGLEGIAFKFFTTKTDKI